MGGGSVGYANKHYAGSIRIGSFCQYCRVDQCRPSCLRGTRVVWYDIESG